MRLICLLFPFSALIQRCWHSFLNDDIEEFCALWKSSEDSWLRRGSLEINVNRKRNQAKQKWLYRLCRNLYRCRRVSTGSKTCFHYSNDLSSYQIMSSLSMRAVVIWTNSLSYLCKYLKPGTRTVSLCTSENTHLFSWNRRCTCKQIPDSGQRCSAKHRLLYECTAEVTQWINFTSCADFYRHSTYVKTHHTTEFLFYSLGSLGSFLWI